MKFLFLLATTLPILLLAAPPKWYINQSYKPQNPSTYIGYGEGKSLKEASQGAKAMIAGMIETQVQDTSIKVRQRQGEGFKSGFATKSKQTSSITLKDTKPLKSICQDDGLFKQKCFVALKYWHVSDLYRFASKLTDAPSQAQHPYLKHTPLIKRLNAYTGNTPSYTLMRDKGQLALEHQGMMHSLKRAQILSLFATHQNAPVDITLIDEDAQPLGGLANGDEFYIRLSSKQKGFVSAFVVFEDGSVWHILQNQAISTKTPIIYPDLKGDEALVATLLEPQTPTKDLYVVLFAKKPLEIGHFTAIKQTLTHSPKAKVFDLLVGLMSDYKFSTKVITTTTR